MDSYILEDINNLLSLKKGDASRLNSIKLLCEANEIVSISDRKYIERLVSQYLRKTEPIEPKAPKPKTIPPIESTVSSPSVVEEKTSEAKSVDKVQISESLKSEKNYSISFDLSYNQKILFAIGAIILAVILISVVVIGYYGDQITDDSDVKNSITLPGFSLEVDGLSYEAGDIISISGQVSDSSGTVRLSIQNENGVLIWEENVETKKNGDFSTLLIAGGAGWENSGKYILKGEHAELINEISFDFIS
jgi:hypothetical protein